MRLHLTQPSWDIAVLEAAVHQQFKRYDKLAFALEAMVMRGELHNAKPLQRAKDLCGMARELRSALTNMANNQSRYPKRMRELDLNFTGQLVILQDGLAYQLQRYEELLHFVAKKNDAVLDEYSCQGFIRCQELHDAVCRLHSAFKATPKSLIHAED